MQIDSLIHFPNHLFDQFQQSWQAFLHLGGKAFAVVEAPSSHRNKESPRSGTIKLLR